MKYQVQLSERLFVTVAVEASSEAEALALAQRRWRNEADKIEWVEEPAVIAVVTATVPEPATIHKRLLEASAC